MILFKSILIRAHFPPRTIREKPIGSHPAISKSVSTIGTKPRHRCCTGLFTWLWPWEVVLLFSELGLLSGFPKGDGSIKSDSPQQKQPPEPTRGLVTALPVVEKLCLRKQALAATVRNWLNVFTQQGNYWHCADTPLLKIPTPVPIKTTRGPLAPDDFHFSVTKPQIKEDFR